MIPQKSSSYPIKSQKTSSKSKKLQKERVKEVLALQRFKPIIYKVFGVYQTHRLYGDLVFSDQLFDLGKDSVFYIFQPYSTSKMMRQIHVRKHGIVLEFEDFEENYVSSLDFIKSRMYSLGNKDAIEFCDILDQYKNFFLNEKRPPPKNPIEVKFVPNLECVDELFEKHKEDVLFLRGSKFINPKDFRTNYLGFNSKLLEWITTERNVYSQGFISDCVKIFPMKSHNDFFDVMKVVIGTIDGYKRKLINTVMGEIEKTVVVKMTLLPKSQQFFHYLIHPKEDFDPIFLDKLKQFRLKKEEKNEKKEIDRNKSILYAELMKTYYRK